MKRILWVLFVVAVVLFVTVESRRKRPKKPGKGCLIRNCSRCDDGRRKCQECDDGFVRITYNLKRVNKTSCEPCVNQKVRKQARKQVIERDDSKCPAVNVTEAPCRKNCASCNSGGCIECNEGFALVSNQKNVTFCVPCVRRKVKLEIVDESKCPVNVTGAPCRKNCASCNNGGCIECNEGFALVSNKKNVTFCIPCVRRKVKLEIVDESKCPVACAKGCLNCFNGNCSECKTAFQLNLETRQCEKKVCGKGCVNCDDSGTCTECDSKKGLALVRRKGKSKCVRQRKLKPKRKGGKRGPKTPQP